MRVRLFMFATLVMALAAVVGAPGAYAETTTCTGALNGVMLDNVKVPRGATCTLNGGTRVKGNLKVGPDATLRVVNVRIGGNVQGKESSEIKLNGTTTKVGGSVQAKEAALITLTNVKVKGEVQLIESDVITLTNLKVNGDIQLFENFDAIILNNNKIGGNLQCKENFEDPTGANNRVKGNAEDQCDSAIAIEI